MPDIVEIGPEWDPGAHDYEATSTPLERGILAGVLGLAAVSAFSLVGVGAFFTTEAAAAGAIGEGVTVNGTTYYGITQATAEALYAAEAAGFSQEAATAVVSSGVMGGGSALDAAALIALQDWEPPSPNQFSQFGHYMGPYALFGNPLGGIQTPPGFPGFFGGPGVTLPPGVFRVCFELEATGITYCTFYQ